jgi:AcrR family transcriptional regulator
MTRPGGRTESNRKAVATAVLKMVKNGNLIFDIQDVAELSGVHRTTIRRRWPDRDALLAEAMTEHTSHLAIDLSGDWKSVVRKIAFGLRDFFTDPMEDTLNRLIAVSANEDFTRLVRDHWLQIYQKLAAPLAEAQKRGRLAVDVDIPVVLRILSATIWIRFAYSRERVDDEFVERLVQQLIRGMNPIDKGQRVKRSNGSDKRRV